MVKTAVIGALAPLLLASAARADWRTPIQGAEPTLAAAFTLTVRPVQHPRSFPMPGATPILPSRFTPIGAAVTAPFAPAASAVFAPASPPDDDAANLVSGPAQAIWSLPLVDRRLTQSERTADLAPDLQDAILRVEPMYDPTRLDGADAEVQMAVSSGTAAMNNVFADRWRRASPDANVNVKTTYLAMAWQTTGTLPCDAFLKNRPHRFGDAALTALTEDDCRRLWRYQALGFDAAPTSSIVMAPVSVPVFAAPLPGSRMSSQDFWAERKARIEAIQAHLQSKWQKARWPGAREQMSDIEKP